MGRRVGCLTYSRSGFEVEDSRVVIVAGRSALGADNVSISMSMFAQCELSSMLYKYMQNWHTELQTFCAIFNTLVSQRKLSALVLSTLKAGAFLVS